jgi:glycosyltransferase involved in cell wall biosynthesis
VKKISIVTPVFNESENIEVFLKKIKGIMLANSLNYEHIVIDNNSTDETQKKLKIFAQNDKNLKIIINLRNFGWVRSSYHALMQCSSDAAILISADFQDPPELIMEFIKFWNLGYKIILGRKIDSNEFFFKKFLRVLFYKFINKISETKLTKNTLGFGLYDSKVLKDLKLIDDPYPYLRGLITELGYPIHLIDYIQPKRLLGRSNMNFAAMYDVGITGIVKHSKLPLRFFVILGFLMTFLSLIAAIFCMIYKLIYWDVYSVGASIAVIGIFMICSLNMFLLGLTGEYIITILTHVRKLPVVFEKERINF